MDPFHFVVSIDVSKGLLKATPGLIFNNVIFQSSIPLHYTICSFFLDFNYKKVRKSSKLIYLILILIWMYNFNFCLNLKYLIVELKLMIKHGSFTKINEHKYKHFVFQTVSKLFMNRCFIYNPNYTLTINL